MILPKCFKRKIRIFSPTGGCSEGLGAFLFLFKQQVVSGVSRAKAELRALYKGKNKKIKNTAVIMR